MACFTAGTISGSLCYEYDAHVPTDCGKLETTTNGRLDKYYTAALKSLHIHCESLAVIMSVS